MRQISIRPTVGTQHTNAPSCRYKPYENEAQTASTASARMFRGSKDGKDVRQVYSSAIGIGHSSIRRAGEGERKESLSEERTTKGDLSRELCS